MADQKHGSINGNQMRKWTSFMRPVLGSNPFLGSEAVTLMVDNSMCSSRSEGVMFGQQLLLEGTIESVGIDSNVFMDCRKHYRFARREDSDTNGQEEESEQMQAAPLAGKPWQGLDVQYIVSVDFGSFGFAASFCPPNEPSYDHIVQNYSYNRASADLNKNLAALLIDKKTQETVAMGYEAEEKYKKAQERKEDDQYMYFQHFKPYLYS